VKTTDGPTSRIGEAQAEVADALALLDSAGIPGRDEVGALLRQAVANAARSLAESSAPDPTKLASVAKLWADYPQLWGGAESEADPAAATMAALVAEAARADSIRRVMGET
jgi:hypothetical protein